MFFFKLYTLFLLINSKPSHLFILHSKAGLPLTQAICPIRACKLHRRVHKFRVRVNTLISSLSIKMLL